MHRFGFIAILNICVYIYYNKKKFTIKHCLNLEQIIHGFRFQHTKKTNNTNNLIQIS